MKNCKTSTLFSWVKKKIITEFSIVNPGLLDLDLEDSDSALVVSTIIDDLLLPHEQFCEICC